MKCTADAADGEIAAGDTEFKSNARGTWDTAVSLKKFKLWF